MTGWWTRTPNKRPWPPTIPGFQSKRDRSPARADGLSWGVGKITLGGLLELWIEHDRGHVQELEKLRVAVR